MSDAEVPGSLVDLGETPAMSGLISEECNGYKKAEKVGGYLNVLLELITMLYVTHTMNAPVVAQLLFQ